MNLGDFLDARRAVVPLPGETLTDAVTALVRRLEATAGVAEPEVLRQRIAEERAEDLVTMGGRAFLVHYRTDAVRELAVAIGTASSPICLLSSEEEGPCARIVIVVVAPPKQAGRYLQLLGVLGRALQREEDANRLLGARSAEELVSLPFLRTIELPQQLTVSDLMTERPRTTTADAPLHDAAWQMLRGGLGALPVVDSEYRLVGMLSDRDLLREVVVSLQGGPPKPSQSHGGARQVRDLMTRHVLCVAPEQPLAEVASLMSHKDVDRVPVVREGRLVGFLTRGDILRKLMGF